MKKIFTFLIGFVLLFSSLFVNAKTNSNETKTDMETKLEKLTATKVSIKDLNEKVGEYDIKITMPGEEKKIAGFNFLFVMDASYSTDEEWKEMREAVLETVNLLLTPNAASDSFEITNRVALMTFGMGEHLIIPFTQDENVFKETLKVDIGGSLLYPGRSATNNEVGFTGAYKYLENYKKEMAELGISVNKENTYVIYLSDGNSNLNERPVNFYKVGQNSYLANQRKYLYEAYQIVDKNKDKVVSPLILNFIEEIKDLYLSETGSEETKENLSLETIKTKIGSKESFINLMNNQITKLYKEIGYDLDKEYSASEYERMVNYYPFSENRTLQLYLENMFYMPIKSLGYDEIENANRAIAAGFKLDEIANIYTIGFNLWRADAGKIMNPEFAGGSYDGQTFTPNFTMDNDSNKEINHFSKGYYSSTADTVKLYLKQVSDKIIYRNYKDITIVDYTSKWVIPMDIDGDLEFTNKDIVVKNGDRIIENPNLTVHKLTLDELKELEQLEDKDLAVVGNTNGNIYRITLTVNDKLTSLDKYTITYRVKVDTQENGFVSNQEYVANGKTTLNYSEYEFEYKNEKTEDGSNKIVVEEKEIGKYSNDIIVPLVKQHENIVIIKKIDETGNLLSGADFEIISNNGIKQVIKYYSVDGNTWSLTNLDNKATYFKFVGLYDYNYSIKETKTPNTYYQLDDNLIFNFTNLENQEEKKDVENEQIKGEVIVNYVIKVDDKYIPFEIFGVDELGNKTPDFKDVDIEQSIFNGVLGEEFETVYRDLNNYNFIGIYRGNINESIDLEKLSGQTVKGKFELNQQEYTYVYEAPIGDSEDDILPPQTGVELTINSFNIFVLLGICYIFNKYQLSKKN